MFEFPKSARLLKSEQYTAVFRGAEINISAGPLRIRAIKNRMPTARLGLVVTKKGTPKANRRNRVKRIIREKFRLQATDLPNIDLVIQVFGQIDDVQLHRSVDKLFALIERDFEQANE